MNEESHDIKKEVKKYYFVFAALIALSVLTVAASYINFGVALGIAVALFIATIKSSLVASFFMHLIAEKKLIYVTLIMTAFFFVSMMILFIASYHSTPEGLRYLNKDVVPAVEQKQHQKEEGHHVP